MKAPGAGRTAQAMATRNRLMAMKKVATKRASGKTKRSAPKKGNAKSKYRTRPHNEGVNEPKQTLDNKPELRVLSQAIGVWDQLGWIASVEENSPELAVRARHVERVLRALAFAIVDDNEKALEALGKVARKNLDQCTEADGWPRTIALDYGGEHPHLLNASDGYADKGHNWGRVSVALGIRFMVEMMLKETDKGAIKDRFLRAEKAKKIVKYVVAMTENPRGLLPFLQQYEIGIPELKTQAPAAAKAVERVLNRPHSTLEGKAEGCVVAVLESVGVRDARSLYRFERGSPPKA